MGVESASWVKDLNSANPTSNDTIVQGDDHIRLLKSVILATFPNADHAIYLEQAHQDITAAATTDLSTKTTNHVQITGNTGITSFGTLGEGQWRFLRFSGTPIITHNGTSLILPGAANIQVAAGDRAIALSLGSGNWLVVAYIKADGSPVAFTDNTIALTKIANIATARFLGRVTAATGAVEALTGTQATTLLDAFTSGAGAPGLKGLVPAPQSGDTGKYLRGDATWATVGSPAPDVILEDQKAQNTAGGTFTSGADRTRTLNTEVRDPSNLCSLASNQFTLAAGTYYIEWSAPAHACDGHQSLLYDITGATELKRGTSATSQNNTSHGICSTGQHVFTIGGSNVFEIRHRCTTTRSTDGFGWAANFGTEIYTVVKIWKIA